MLLGAFPSPLGQIVTGSRGASFVTCGGYRDSEILEKKTYFKKSLFFVRPRDVTVVPLACFFPDPVTQRAYCDPLGHHPLGSCDPLGQCVTCDPLGQCVTCDW